MAPAKEIVCVTILNIKFPPLLFVDIVSFYKMIQRDLFTHNRSAVNSSCVLFYNLSHEFPLTVAVVISKSFIAD